MSLFFFRNTDMWTTSCLKTTPSQIAFWTFGGKRVARGWAICMAGTPSTKTSLWASELRLLPSMSPPRWESNPTCHNPPKDVVRLLLWPDRLYGLSDCQPEQPGAVGGSESWNCGWNRSKAGSLQGRALFFCLSLLSAPLSSLLNFWNFTQFLSKFLWYRTSDSSTLELVDY